MFRPGLVRFILATLVVFYHLNRSIFFGYFAVGCFFILSGYWIALMFEKKYSKKVKTLKVYYISRLWRLLPVFYTFTILGLIVNFHFNSISFDNLDKHQKVGAIISNIIIFGYSNLNAKILVPAWSLDVEMQFYLILPLLAYVIKSNKRLLYGITLFFFIIALFLIYINHAVLISTSLTYLYLFFIGVIAYHFKISPGIKLEKISLAILVTIVAIQYSVPSLASYYRDGDSKYYVVLSLVLILFAIPSLLNSVHKESNKKDRYLGEMSFLIYLSHWVWFGPYNLLIKGGTKFERIPYALGFLLVTFLSAYLVYKFIDRPSEILRHKWINAQR
ncbi:MAG: acyltransferase [Ginsengibacter sp.]